jgi:energy-coupling factor transport system ATP-binding protein
MDTLTLSVPEQTAVRQWFAAESKLPSARAAAELLRVEDARFAYPDTGADALRGVSFAVGAGEMTAIVGENGAGKSTLAKLICGFERLDAGRILLRGEDMAGESIAARAAYIGYVMQNPNQMISKPMLFDEVALGLRNRGMGKAEVQTRVDETLRVCGLRPFRKWPVSALSFGQKKRVAIASVLAMDPEIILLDEPTAGQDFRHYTEFMEFLRGLNERGVTVLMITHDMHLMLEYASRALVFAEGRLLADTTPARLLCDGELTGAASLTETSLFYLAERCGVTDAAAFVQRFIDCDREARAHG